MKILLIDNYDSFTYNLYHCISKFNKNVIVVRNDKINSKTNLRKKYQICYFIQFNLFFNLPSNSFKK